MWTWTTGASMPATVGDELVVAVQMHHEVAHRSMRSRRKQPLRLRQPAQQPVQLDDLHPVQLAQPARLLGIAVACRSVARGAWRVRRTARASAAREPEPRAVVTPIHSATRLNAAISAAHVGQWLACSATDAPRRAGTPPVRTGRQDRRRGRHRSSRSQFARRPYRCASAPGCRSSGFLQLSQPTDYFRTLNSSSPFGGWLSWRVRWLT